MIKRALRRKDAKVLFALLILRVAKFVVSKLCDRIMTAKRIAPRLIPGDRLHLYNLFYEILSFYAQHKKMLRLESFF